MRVSVDISLHSKYYHSIKCVSAQVFQEIFYLMPTHHGWCSQCEKLCRYWSRRYDSKKLKFKYVTSQRRHYSMTLNWITMDGDWQLVHLIGQSRYSMYQGMPLFY